MGEREGVEESRRPWFLCKRSSFHMESCSGGSSTPSYKDAVANRSKGSTRNSKSDKNYKIKDNEKEIDGTRTKENSSTKDKEEEDKSLGSK